MIKELFIALIALLFIALFLAIKRQAPFKNPPQDKQLRLLQEYEQRLCDELQPIYHDKDLCRSKRAELLKIFTKELAFNVFYNQERLRETIAHLAAFECPRK